MQKGSNEADLRRLDEAFGRVLARLRRERGMSQSDLGGAASRTYVSDLERGLKSPSLRTIARLADQMGMSAARLIGLAEEDARGGAFRI